MPKETFLKLSEEKKQKVLNAAKREFARVPIEQVSIKNIVEDAEIARGSFYQYFESKEDLLAYILKENADEIDTKIKNKIYETKGNIFDAYIELYDLMVKKFVENTEQEFQVLHLLGGGTKDAFLCQMTADSLGIPVIAGPTEATALGNILLQLIALRVIDSVESARHMVREWEPLKTYSPISHKQWSEAYCKYRSLLK